jgi:hypothetical protein
LLLAFEYTFQQNHPVQVPVEIILIKIFELEQIYSLLHFPSGPRFLLNLYRLNRSSPGGYRLSMKSVLLCVLTVLSVVRSQVKVRSGELYIHAGDSIFIACDLIREYDTDGVCLHCISAVLDWNL